jgi:ParB-like chromosome segregation protein Spo0J
MPVLIDEQVLIIAGHGRVEAAKLIGIDTVPVIVARGWTEAQRRAYAIADNRLTENSEWDKDLLALELSEL